MNTETKHTPGPWKVKHSETKPAFNVISTRLGCKYKIARCPYGKRADGSLYLDDEARADAKLIASAPDLLAENTAQAELIENQKKIIEETDKTIEDQKQLIKELVEGLDRLKYMTWAHIPERFNVKLNELLTKTKAHV